MRVVGLAHVPTVESLPSQPIVIFEKRESDQRRPSEIGQAFVTTHLDSMRPRYPRTLKGRAPTFT